MTQPTTQHRLTNRQLECLCSPVRVNLYEAICRSGRLSVCELARELNKTVHSLYYHLRKLEQVKLIQIADYRRVGKKDEALYEAVSKRLTVDRNNSNPAYRESLIKAVHLMLRKAEREHRNSRQLELNEDHFGLLRLQAQLSSDDARRLRKKLQDLGSWIRKRSQPDNYEEKVSVSCLIVPLE